jgi:ATP-dependent Lon protease
MIGKKSLVQTIARQLNKKLIHLDASKYANFDEVITFTNDKPNELLRLIHEAGVNNPMIVIDSLDYVLNENNKNFLICRLFKQILSYETNNKI